jgi:hypothetical protein
MQRQRFISPYILSAFAALMTFGARTEVKAHEMERRKRRTFYKLGSYSYKPNGLRECERRKRQIEAGSLRVENGLSP